MRIITFKWMGIILFFVMAFKVNATISTVIFDVDGVLVDTEYLKFEAWRDALSNQNLSFTIDEYLPLVGYSSEKIADEIAKSKRKSFNKDELIQQKNEIYKIRQAQGVPSLPKAVTFLKYLLENKKKYGIKIGLASSAPNQEIINNVRNIGINPKEFDAIISGQDDLKHITDTEGTNKPKPYIYYEIAKKLKVNPKDCVVFEDTYAGIESASSAGMTAIAVPNQYTQKQDFSKSAAMISFDDFTVQQFERQYLKSDKMDRSMR